MPRLILAAVFLLALFVVLCGPVFAVALRLRRRGDRTAMRQLRAVWLAQVVVAGGLMLLADTAQLANPGAWMAGILVGVSLGGSALFAGWRMARRIFARRSAARG